MSELQQLESALRQTANWRRWYRAWLGFWRGLLLGSVVWLVVLGGYKVLPVPTWMPVAGGIAAVVMALLGLMAGGWRRGTLLETARWVDEQKHLEERVSTALELATAGGAEEWRRLLTHDAAQHVHDLQPRRLLPLHLPKASRWTLLILGLAVGLGFVPEYRTEAYVRRQQDAKNIHQVGKELAELMRHTLLEKPPALQPTRQALATVAQTGDQLTKAPLTRSEALRDLSNVAEKLAKQDQELGRNPALQRLQRSARNPGGAEGPSAADLQKKMDDLKQALGKAGGDPEKLDALQKKLQNLKRKAASMAGQDGSMGQGQRSQLAGAMGDLSETAQSLGAALPGLESAIEALKAGKTDLFLRDLETALNDLEQMKQTAKALQQCQQQAEKLGKDLAEQLDKGQARAAQSTMQKMIDQLKAGNPSSEQLQQMMSEVSKAVQPGSQYGKVGQYLKQAAQNLRQGQKQNAAQNLADAAKELEQLQQQMADAQALRDALDALQRAQSAIAMGQSWEELSGVCSHCNGQGCRWCRGSGRKLAWGPGGRPGMGVGTWADESGWNQYNTENWGRPFDPSGVQRPDMDPRGQSDRPDDLPPGLAPTKVRGKFQPGGSMPSIKLKGLNIKGTSTVEYEQAAAAAQSAAENALEQDKVPRAYQQTVRDYFDDLKKKKK